LPQAVDPADALLQHCRVPGQLDVDARARGSLQVEADAAGIGREQHPAGRVVVEVHDVLRASPLALLAREVGWPDALRASWSRVAQWASRSIRRHWLNTTTLRP
jgi:hypothetical protein